MPKAYSYIRFSTPEQLTGDSLRRQTKAAREYADRHGIDLDETLTFQDLGVSGFRGKNAEKGALSAFRRLAEDGVIEHGSYLLIENTDRLTRLPAWEAAQLLGNIVAEGIRIVDLSGPREYSRDTLTEDPYAFLTFVLGAMRGHEESARKALVIRGAWERKRENAKQRPLTAACPAWLELDKEAGRFTVLEDRAEVVRRIYRDTLAGIGENAIAKALNTERTPTFGSGKRKADYWHRSYVAKILRNSAVVGEFTPHVVEHDKKTGKRTRIAQEPVPGYFPAVVDAETFQRVQDQLSARDGSTAAPLRGRHADRPVANLFGGIIRCALCGAAVTLVNKGQGKGKGRYLVCAAAKTGAGCTYLSIPYGEVEVRFLEEAPKLIAEAPAGDADRYEGELAGIEDELPALDYRIRTLTEEIAEESNAGVRSELRTAMAVLVEQRDGRKARRAEIWRLQEAARGPLVERKLTELSTALQAEPIDRGELNALLRQVFAGVTLNRPRGTMVFAWRHGGEAEIVVDWGAFFGQS